MNDTVLIVDDSLTVRADLSEAFETAGLQTLSCTTIAEARAALARQRFGLIVLDVLLPDGDGVNLLKEIRAASENEMPVMMLSAEAEVKDRVRGLKTGATEYVGKPYDSKYMIARARELMRARLDAKDDHPVVLLIDDSATFRMALGAELESAGYVVMAAESGKQALALIAQRRPHAIVVDSIMPRMDGAALIRRVRLDAAVRSVPCLMLTATDDTASELRALEAGADAFVRKDGDIAVILARLGAAMRNAQGSQTGNLQTLDGPRRILAVDDSATYLHELADALGGEGYDVVLARTGEEALELLAVQSVDCILLDLIMPGLGGKETCRNIKSASTVRGTPLIMLTSVEDRATMLDILGTGADDYIPKSSEFEVLKARVRAQIRRKQFEDENRRFRDQLLHREMEAAAERTARELAETRAAMVDELERKVAERTRELEKQIVERQHAERLASVGMLAASVAHEINNPLAVVTGNLDIMADIVKTPGEAGRLDEPLRDALDAADRVRNIVNDLRVFARSDDGVAAPVDLLHILDSAMRMASNEVRHRARLVRALNPVPAVRGSDSRLGQVFLNLIVNAAQAMPTADLDRNEIRISTLLEKDGFVVAEVRDNGVGIPPELQQKLFQPFFTTKPAGQGTGLGLAICHRIITELGGAITVESEHGIGTSFRVKLPAASAAPASAPSAAAQTGPVVTPRRRILVIDDEPALCKTIDRILAPQHEIFTTTSAAEAIGLIERGERYEVVLCDLMMPQMSGAALHHAIAQIAPDQAERMRFMTGGVFSEELASFLQTRSAPTLSKPFKANDLQAFVARL